MIARPGFTATAGRLALIEQTPARAVVPVVALLGAVLTPLLCLAEATPSKWQIDRAIDCAALAYISTSAFEPESAEGASFTARSAFFSEVMAAHLAEETSDVITNGMVSEAKSERVRLIDTLWAMEPQEVLAANRLCWEWAKGLGLRLQRDPETDLTAPIEDVRLPLDRQNVEAADQLLEAAIQAFRSSGAITPQTRTEMLKRIPLE